MAKNRRPTGLVLAALVLSGLALAGCENCRLCRGRNSCCTGPTSSGALAQSPGLSNNRQPLNADRPLAIPATANTQPGAPSPSGLQTVSTTNSSNPNPSPGSNNPNLNSAAPMVTNPSLSPQPVTPNNAVPAVASSPIA